METWQLSMGMTQFLNFFDVCYLGMFSKLLVGSLIILACKLVYFLIRFSFICQNPTKKGPHQSALEQPVFYRYEVRKRSSDLQKKISIRDAMLKALSSDRGDSRLASIGDSELVRKRDNHARKVMLARRNLESHQSQASYCEIQKSYPTIPDRQLMLLKKKSEAFEHKRCTSLKYLL